MDQITSPSPKLRRIALLYGYTAFAIFFVLVLLGMLMRLNQYTGDTVTPLFFYAMMTLHGLGMAGTMFIAGFVGVWYLLGKYVKASTGVLLFVYVLVLIGTVGLIIATLIGQFGPGWYMLYPLPFISVWPHWSIGLGVASVMILGVAWLVGQVELMRAMAARFGFKNLLGWQYFGPEENRIEIPPFVIITTVALIAGIIATLSGASLLMLYLAQWFVPTLHFNPLLLKNAVFLFGHTLVNITMYLGIAIVYELMPKFTNRPWTTNTIVVLSWNIALVLVLFAFAHHLYMDYAQPITFQYLGQIVSYMSAIPATVVTVIGMFGQVYRSGVKWKVIPLSFFLGIMGWVVGGIAALVDSTIAVNMVFHNTLWVPAHFHTYFILGFLFIMFGFFYYLKDSAAECLGKFALWIMMLGGYFFVLMFYIGGFSGVPRRFSSYTAIPLHSVVTVGQDTAFLSLIGISIFLLGFFAYIISISCFRRKEIVEN